MRRVIFLLIALLAAFIVSAQRNNYPLYPEKKLTFGLATGPATVITFPSRGWSAGGGAYLRLSKRWYFNPGILFTSITYSLIYKVNAGYIEAPMHLFYRINKTQKPFSPVFSIGPNYKYDLSLNHSHWYADFAIGIEQRLKYFSVVPQLRYSYSKTLESISFLITVK